MAYSDPRVPTVNIVTADPVNMLIIHGEVHGTPPTGAGYPGIFALECLLSDVDGSGIYEMTGTVAVPAWTLISSGATGDQSAIQFQDEGINLGSAGTVTTENYVGAGVTATRLGDTVTVVIPGGSGSGSAYNLGNALTYASLAGTSLTLTSFSSPSVIATGNTGETTMAGVAGLYGSGSDLVATGAYAAALADAAAQYSVLKALAGTAITTPATLETNNLSGLGAGVFAPGVYTTASAIGMTAARSITLNGAGDYVFISTGGAITFGATDTMILTNGATADRVFFVANNAITTGSTDILFGNFMSGVAGAITIGSTNIIQGRLISPVAITVDGTATTLSLPVGGQGSLAQGTVVTGTNATGTTYSVINTSTYTGVGINQIIANGLSSGVANFISIAGASSGIGQLVVAAAGVLTTGRYYSANNGTVEVFGIGLNGHIISTVSATAPSATVGTVQGITAAAIVVGSSDTAGGFTTTGTQNNTADSTVVVTFGKTYTTAPKAVMLTGANASSGLAGAGTAYISAITATNFTVGISKSAVAGATPAWNYIVIA